MAAALSLDPEDRPSVMQMQQRADAQARASHRPLPTAYCPLPTAHCLLPTAYCLLPTAHCPLPTAYCLLPTAYGLLPTWATLRETSRMCLSSGKVRPDAISSGVMQSTHATAACSRRGGAWREGHGERRHSVSARGP